MKTYSAMVLLLGISLVRAVEPAPALIRDCGEFVTEKGSAKLVIGRTADKRLAVSLHDVLVGMSGHGDLAPATVREGQWACLFEGEQKAWFYDGLGIVRLVEITDTGFRFSSSVVVHELKARAPAALQEFITAHQANVEVTGEAGPRDYVKEALKAGVAGSSEVILEKGVPVGCHSSYRYCPLGATLEDEKARFMTSLRSFLEEDAWLLEQDGWSVEQDGSSRNPPVQFTLRATKGTKKLRIFGALWFEDPKRTRITYVALQEERR